MTESPAIFLAESMCASGDNTTTLVAPGAILLLSPNANPERV
ncbi:hypothetical protein [Burkholderia ubonensis]|nr:hypothetical protein [Burkholderia ubonensis]